MPLTSLSCDIEMNSVNLATAKSFAAGDAVTGAELVSPDGKKWIIILCGNADFVLKSDCQSLVGSAPSR